MPRKSSQVLSVITVLVLGSLYFFVDAFLERLQQEPEAPLQRAPRDTSVFAPPLPAPAQPVVEDIAPLERRELEIVGHVFDAHNRPQASGEVRIAEEMVAISGDGTFRFPPAIRPRMSTVSFRSPGREASSFDHVITGDLESADSTGSEGAVVSVEDEINLKVGVPRKPMQLRLTFILSEAEVPTTPLWIQVGDVLVEEWGQGGRFRVRGRSNLPSGAHVYANLFFDRVRIANTHYPDSVEDGAWQDIVPCVETLHLFAGLHRLEASFNVRLENAAEVQAWPQSVLEQFKKTGAEVVTHRDVFVGDPRDDRREDLEAQRYCIQILNEGHRLDKAFRSRMNEVRVMGRGWSPSLLEAHQEAHASWFQESFVSSDGILRESNWRRFLDEEWRPEVQRILSLHEMRSVTGTKYQELEARVAGLLDSLLRLSYLYSSHRVYAQFGLPGHPKDAYVAGGDALGDITLLESRLEDNFTELDRFTRLVPEDE